MCFICGLLAKDLIDLYPEDCYNFVIRFHLAETHLADINWPMNFFAGIHLADELLLHYSLQNRNNCQPAINRI